MARLTSVVGPFQPTGQRDTVLVVATSEDQHADAVEAALVRRGLLVCRLNVEALGRDATLGIRLDATGGAEGVLRLATGEFTTAEMRSAWLRRPMFGLLGREWPAHPLESFARREAEWALRGLFELLTDAWWLNSPRSLYSANPKLGQLRAAAALGFTIPRSLVTDDPERAKAFIDECAGDVIVKAFQGEFGTGRSDTSLIYTRRLNADDLRHLQLVRHSPCIFQEYVPKQVEIRATIVGRRVFAAEIACEADGEALADWRRPGLRDRPKRACTLPADCEAACLRLLDHWDLEFGAIDLIQRPDGTYVFLELNPLADWLWVEATTGLPITEAVADALERSA